MKLIDRLVSLWQQEQPLEVLPKPGLDRRAFLKILGSSAAIAAAVPMLDLEALIWTPRPIITVPWGRYVTQYRVVSGLPTRMDVLYGFAKLQAAPGAIVLKRGDLFTISGFMR